MARGVWVSPSGGRAIVLAQHVRGGRVGSTGRHLSYLQRDGVGEDGGKGQLFTAEDHQIDPEAFRYQASHDLSQYRVVVSPWSRGEHMQEYTRDLMHRVERDLGTETQWLSASHHNTAHPHSHVVIRGVDAHDKPLQIDKRYLEHGIKERAGEVERDRQFDRGYDSMLQREQQQLHKVAEFGPRDERYQATLKERLAEIRQERQEMRQYERGADLDHSPGRQRAQELIERVGREREQERGMER